jgi:aminopeptidase S
MIALAALASIGVSGCVSQPTEGVPTRANRDAGVVQATLTPDALARSVTTAGLVEHLRALADIGYRNGGSRAAGTSGDLASRRYVAERLRAAGYRVWAQRLRIGRRTTSNVLAETRTGAASRVVMAGAHLDSVRNGPGINDNGSGVAALLEIAEGLAASPSQSTRVRFAFWGAEEPGFIGSRRYVRSLSRVERRAIVGYLNFDMLGSRNPVPEVYDGRSVAGPGRRASIRIERVLRRQFQRTGRLLDELPSEEGGSDHLPFEAAGVPIGGLDTGDEDVKSRRQAQRHGGRAGAPPDPCYHRACDTLKNVDHDVLTDMAQAAGAAIVALSARPRR